MHLGLDFDNTIVSYDTLFHRVAREQGLIPDDVPVSKNAVRDFLRAAGREPEWTAMQGVVYGARMVEAEPFPGVLEFLAAGAKHGIEMSIVSHKTRHPIVGEPYDLHAAAEAWLEKHGVFAAIPRERVHFELTKPEKLARIGTIGCTHFLDDLPELLAEPKFPSRVTRLLFDPLRVHSPAEGVTAIASWAALGSLMQAKAAHQGGGAPPPRGSHIPTATRGEGAPPP